MGDFYGLCSLSMGSSGSSGHQPRMGVLEKGNPAQQPLSMIKQGMSRRSFIFRMAGSFVL